MSKIRIYLFAVMLLIVSAFSFPVAAQDEGQARSVILLISDGAGPNHQMLAEMYAEQILGSDTYIRTMPYTAYTSTLNIENNITDSAAAGSALHTGGRYVNGTINVDEEGMSRFSIGYAAQEAGKSVGVVSTARLTHATPATVYATVPDRGMENEIAGQLLEFTPDVALGGGIRHFLPEDADGRRDDGRDLTAEFAEAGYTVVTTGSELNAVDLANTGQLLGLFTSSHMSYELDRVQQELDEPSLAEMTSAALEILGRNENGFFLSVEAARVDHASHSNDTAGMLWDQLAFEDAVRVALEYQAANPDTLVIVTADHDCGGFVLGRDDIFSVNLAHLEEYTCSIEYTMGQIADDMSNVDEVLAACSWTLNEEQQAMLDMMPLDTPPGETGVSEFDSSYAFNWLHFVLVDAQNRGAEVGWTSWTHTATPVFTFAQGPGAEALSGSIHLEDIAFTMAEAMGVSFPEPVALAN